MKLHTFTATRVSSTSFPIDMLRSDTCWPTTKADSFKLVHLLAAKRGSATIVSLTGLAPPTIARWESFGWTISAHTTVDRA